MEKKELLDSTCNSNFTLVGLRLDLTSNLSKILPSLMICIWIKELIGNIVTFKNSYSNGAAGK